MHTDRSPATKEVPSTPSCSIPKKLLSPLHLIARHWPQLGNTEMMMATILPGHDQSSKTPLKERSISVTTHYYTPRLTIYFLITFIVLLILLQIQSLSSPISFSFRSSTWPIWHTPQSTNCCVELNRTRSRLSDMVTFLSLKNLSLSSNPTAGNTWFMSSIDNTNVEGEFAHLYFPSEATNGKLLCLSGNHHSDGTKNSYALAWPDALPHNATLLSGLTFVSDTYYDYGNLWHGLSAMLPFVEWHRSKDCAVPERWVLYHWGELRTIMGTWVRTLMEAGFQRQVEIERFKEMDGPTCFEKALVVRNNEGGLSKEMRREVYDMMRCKARAYCNASNQEVGDPKAIRLTLLLRNGARSFKDEPTVIRIFETECRKVDRCRLKVAWGNNMTFCDQVRLMSETDIVVSPHGAQLTNLFFMDRNSSIMEFFPKGWLELGGAGQYVFHWMADWSGMQHRGVWRDTEGEQCPYNNNEDCFTFYKDGKIGQDEAFFANWTATVLSEVKEYKLSEASRSHGQAQLTSSACPCS